MDYLYIWRDSVGGAETGRFQCGHCDTASSPIRVWNAAVHQLDSRGNPSSGQIDTAVILVCANCRRPTFLSPREDICLPGPKHGAKLSKLPVQIEKLYEEARSCSAVGAYTAAVMAARKILMNLAVIEGADEGQTFKAYVDYLEAKGFVPPKGRMWVDRIRIKGNEANHEIRVMDSQDCADTMKLTEMLLRFNFELAD